MPQIVYVNEYQSSEACLTLSRDPIYKKSDVAERIRVGVPAPLMLIGPFFVGIVLLVRSI